MVRAAARLLAADRVGSDGGEHPRPGSVFAQIDSIDPDVRSLDLSISVERAGSAPVRESDLRRVFAAELAALNAQRQETGLAPFRINAPGQAADATLGLEVRESRDEVRLELELVRGDLRSPLGSLGPRELVGRSALVPPLLAISVALILRRTLLALFLGVWAGATIAGSAEQSWPGAALLGGLRDVPAVYLRRELLDSFRIEIIGFVVALVGMVGVMSRAGSMQGLVDLILRYARGVRSALLATFGMGLMLFFDDYSNCLIVGNSMRPLTDRLRISREKLAYVVDSTAAPVAGLSVLSTWIAFEVSTYSAQLPAAGIADSAYAVFLQTIPFRFYSLFALGFVLLVILTGRDFGPMRAAESRARSTGQVIRPGGTPTVSGSMTRMEPSATGPRLARGALLPIAAVIAVTVEEIFRTGGGFTLLADSPAKLLSLASLTDLLAAGGGAAPIFAGATVGLALAAFLAGSNSLRLALAAGGLSALLLAGPAARALDLVLPQSLVAYSAMPLIFLVTSAAVGLGAVRAGVSTRRLALPWGEIWRAALGSTRAVGVAVSLLFLAWMIGRVCEDVGTADYLLALTSGRVPPLALPVLLFAVACLVSFATGTSWGTMSILLPNVVVLAAAVGATHFVGPKGMVLVCIGAVLEGSIFGDHCSPISDTTVLSSVSTAADHMDHVRTQMPYALTAASVAVLAGYLPALGFEFWSLPLAILSGTALMLALLLLVGRRTPAQPEPGARGA